MNMIELLYEIHEKIDNSLDDFQQEKTIYDLGYHVEPIESGVELYSKNYEIRILDNKQVQIYYDDSLRFQIDIETLLCIAKYIMIDKSFYNPRELTEDIIKTWKSKYE